MVLNEMLYHSFQRSVELKHCLNSVITTKLELAHFVFLPIYFQFLSKSFVYTFSMKWLKEVRSTL